MFPTYRGGSLALAETLLESSIRAMPESVRCMWTDVSYLISDKKARKEYEAMSCPDRAEFQEKLWWLADPLHSEPGNERRVEHFARHVNMRADNEEFFTRVQGLWWGLKVMRRNVHFLHATDPKDGEMDEELMQLTGTDPKKRLKGFLEVAAAVRGYADPLGFGRSGLSIWERMENSLKRVSIGLPPINIPPARAAFVPSVAAIRAPLQSQPSQWQLDNPYPNEIAASPIGPIVALEHQHAFFRRGDSVRLVVVTDASAQALLRGTLSRGALAITRSPRDTPFIVRTSSSSRYVFSPVVHRDSMLVSVELIAQGRGGGRTRFGAAPSPTAGGRVSISDIGLYLPEPEPSRPDADLDALLDRLLPTTRIAQRSSVGLFWEVYGLQLGDSVRISISAEREETPGAVARAIGGILGGPGPSAFSLSYDDRPAAGAPVEGRKVVIDLSALRAGLHRIQVKVEVRGQPPAVATRLVDIR
jgi:hypothetical protein